VPFGSEGDVNPLIWLAHGLKDRGHSPVLLLTPHYAHRAAGLEWHPIGTEEDFLKLASDPDLWKPFKGTLRVAAAMTGSLGAFRSAFCKLGKQFDLVVTTSFSFAASCVAEAAGIPRLMLHLQPVCMRSVGDFPVMGDEFRFFLGAPDFVKRLLFQSTDLVLDHALLPPLNRFRKDLGLRPWRGFYREALMSGDGVGLLYPGWFAPPQPDWPPGVRQFGFPISSQPGRELPSDLAAWLDAGEPPVVWTHGSANLHVGEFQGVAVAASAAAKARALLVSKVPPSTPLGPGVFHCSHVAFESLFPKCRAVVHHAGIGTVAKAFHAGIPQLAIPLAHDQFDNAARITRLGAGLRCRKTRRSATNALKHLLEAGRFHESVQRCQALAKADQKLAELCDFSENLARHPRLISSPEKRLA